MNFKNKFLLVGLAALTGAGFWHCRNKAEPKATPPPDLTVSVSSSSVIAQPSGMLTLTARVSNTGTGASPETTLRWYLSTDGTIEAEDTPAGDGDVGSLEAGASTTLTNMVTVSGTAGTYHYGACVDAVTDEGDISNNCSSGVAVVVAALAPDPELTVINMRASETSVAPSAMLTLTATVGNTGIRSAPATTLRWYLSADDTIETTDTPAGDGAVGSLESAASVTLMGIVTAPGTAGTHYYGACVDAVPEESDPANNCSAAVAVVVASTSPNPELIVTNMMASRALTAPSGMLTLTATVVNNGGVSPATTLRWYLSTDGTIGTTDTAAGTKSVGTLEAEASTTLMGTVTASMTAGTYYYGACVDPVAEESDTANNCSSGVRVVVSTPSAGARLQAFEFNLAAGNTDPHGLWSDGVTLWVADSGDDKLFAYQMPDGTPDPAKDLTLAAGNTDPRGIWSDGTTMWVVDSPSSGTRKLYAYALASGDYLPAKDLILAAGNSTPTGIWSDGTTLWVGNDDPFDARLYAYSLVSKTRISAQDFTLTARRNLVPTGIWSGGTTMWVADNGTHTEQLYAYKMSDRTSDSTKDFTTLRAAGNDRLFGIWSDGATMWVADTTDDKLYAYDARPLVNTSTLATVRAGLEQITQAPDLLLSVSPESVSTTASATLALTARITNYGVSLAPMSTLRWYRSTDRTLETTDTLLGTATIGSLTAGGGLTLSNMLSAPGTAGTSYYGACADAVTSEHYTGDNCFVVEVTVSTHPHLPASDFNTLSDAGNADPRGLWSDGTTLWVADPIDDKLYAYKTSDKTRDATKDFTLTAENSTPTGLWSDRTTLWVADWSDAKLYAYKMSDETRDSDKDFNTLSAAGNTNPQGIWSDGTTLWVADSADNKLYAYVLESKAHDPTKDIALTGGNADPRGLWSDGTTIWVADIIDDKLYAYVLENGNRDSAKDFTAIVLRAAGNTDPQGIWSDGSTLWVADSFDDELYAYDARALVTAASTE